MENTNKTIIELKREFFEYLDIEKGLSFNSQQTYLRMLKKFFDWLSKNNLSDLKPHQLTEDHIWQYRVFLSRPLPSSGAPLKKSTQNHYLIVLRNLLAFFADRGMVSLPANKIKLAKQSKERSVKFLNVEQVAKLLNSPNTNITTGLRDRAILESFFSTGMRIAELVALNREQIRMPASGQILEVGIIGKGNKPRTVYFSEPSLQWLKKYLQTREDKDPALFVRYKGPHKKSLRLTARAIENLVKKYAILSGVPSSTVPHTLRHSFATDLLGKGVDLRIVQEFLGHRNIATTQIYTHVVSKQLKDIHKKFHGKEDE